MLDWCADAGAAAMPFGGGTSVVGGVEPVVPEGYSGAVSIDLRAMDRVLEVDPVSRRRPDPGRGHRPGARGPAPRARAHAPPLPPVVRVLDARRLGRHARGRALRHRSTHIDDLVESVRVLTPAGVWECRRLPGSGAGPSPDRLVLGSEGILGVITEAWVRVRERPTHRASAGRSLPELRGGARAVRALAQSGLQPSNCRLLDPGEAALTGAAPDGRALLVLGFESADHPLDAWLARGARAVRRPRRRGARRAEERRAGRVGERVAERLRAGAVPPRHHGGRRASRRDLRDGDHLGAARRLRRGGGRARRARRSARARSPAGSPTPTPTARRRTSRCSPPRAAAPSSTSGRR